MFKTLFKVGFFCFFTFEINASLAAGPVEEVIEVCVEKKYKDILKKIVLQESSSNPFAIQTSGFEIKKQPLNYEDALVLIDQLQERKVSFDVGLTQINSQHFRKNGFFGKKGFVHQDALNMCLNVKMASMLLKEAHERTGDIFSALSIYNTGHPLKGIKNGYVDRLLSIEL